MIRLSYVDMNILQTISGVCCLVEEVYYHDCTVFLCPYFYCEHRFATAAEPSNEAIKSKIKWSAERLEAGLPTIPSSVGVELETNPFMRLEAPEVQTYIKAHCEGSAVWTQEDAIRVLRISKNNFGLGTGKK